jgi:hypothetical protein
MSVNGCHLNKHATPVPTSPDQTFTGYSMECTGVKEYPPVGLHKPWGSTIDDIPCKIETSGHVGVMGVSGNLPTENQNVYTLLQ